MTRCDGRAERVPVLDEETSGVAKGRLNPDCVVCGQENPIGLQLAFEADGNASMAWWTASAGWESFKGVIHGGVICAILDEAMSQAAIGAGYTALTAELRVRFRKKVSVDDELCVRGWVVGVRKRKIMAEASLTAADGAEKAHAWATFLMTGYSRG
jgi:acyl-coenzyme A thioesterase PaaI-like protein